MAPAAPVRPAQRVVSCAVPAQVRGSGTTSCQESPNLRHCEPDGPGCLTCSAPFSVAPRRRPAPAHHSDWDENAVRDDVRDFVVETIGAKDAVLIDDEVPFATIAWRIWHIGSLCLRGYEIHFFEDVPELGDRHEWLGTPKKGVQAGRGLGALHLPYRSPRRQAPPGADRHGPVRLADETYLKLALHALKVVTHHGGYQTHPDMAGSWLSPGSRRKITARS